MTNILRFLCAVLLCGLVSTPASAQYLTVDEIKRLFAGTTADTYIWPAVTSGSPFPSETPLRMTLQPDGSLEGEIETSQDSSAVGKWWTEKNDLFCFHWKSLEDGDKQCARLTLQKDGKTIELSRPDGRKFEYDWTIVNPGPQAVAVIVARTGSLVFGAPSRARSPALPSASAPPAQQPLTAARDTQPPVIDVPATIAAEGAVAVISGRIKDASRLIEVTIAGRPVAVGADGSFSARRGVPQGTSTITIVALDEWGNRAERSVTLTRETLAAPTPAPAPPVQRPLAAARDDAPPVIDVPGALAVKSAAVEIAGRVSDSSRIIEVTMDGRPVAVEADGSFSAQRGVPTGESTVTIAAVDEWGNRATRKVTVSREAVVTQRRIKVPGKPPVAPKPRPDPFAGIHFGAYHALVIGNNNYRELPKLRTAVNDAKSVAELLSNDYGFSTKLLVDATRADVIDALARMRAKLKANDNLLIYYAGHGVIDDVTERGYWLPVDAEQGSPTNWVSNDDITAMLRAIRAKHIMVVADSCYSGTLVRATSARMETGRERAAWFKRIVKKRGRTALVSGGLEPVTDAGMGGHSVFANAFLAALSENRDVIDGQTLYQAIKRPVVLNADQTPQYSDIRRAGHDGGDFLFVRKRQR